VGSCSRPPYDGGLGFTLAERWNGRRWLVQRTPFFGTDWVPQLDAVSCTSKRTCTAVGVAPFNAGCDRALVERWDGIRWSPRRLAPPTAQDSETLSGGLWVGDFLYGCGIYQLL
jgi:hypothetical protein